MWNILIMAGFANKEGWIFKQGGSVTSWKQRYLVTEGSGLAYYQNDTKKKRMGFIDLSNATQEGAKLLNNNDSESMKKENVFTICTKERRWYISTSSIDESQDWIELINKKIQILNNNSTSSLSSSSSSSSSSHHPLQKTGERKIRQKRKALRLSENDLDISQMQVIQEQIRNQNHSEESITEGGDGTRGTLSSSSSLSSSSDQIEVMSSTKLFSVESALLSENVDSISADINIKIIIIGDSGVGKTNLMERWMTNKFTIQTPTINVEFATKLFEVNHKLIKVQIWDTAGQEHYRAVCRSYYRNAHGAIIAYDITSTESFESAHSWLSTVREEIGNNDDIQFILVGNKSDLDEERSVSTKQAIKYATENHLNFLETSAKNGDNISEAFQILLQDIYRNILTTTRASETDEGGSFSAKSKKSFVLGRSGNGDHDDYQNCSNSCSGFVPTTTFERFTEWLEAGEN
eukprot:TRINITY_DN5532_c0_g1_i1.p1 TRINITY_DN5532_c0_g1~~TRINITY_DN5532_c0_g1_i1.p1  ORF type:complete len:463 (+),score=77.81 TRINITY_DN5532_c0_g1_i1:54-1442(+)